MFRSVFFRNLLAGVLALTAPMAYASDAVANETWEWGGALYLWGAGIGGTTAEGDDIDVSFNDIIDNLDMAFMGVLQAQKGKWTLLADVIYLDVSAGQTSTANLIGQPVSADLDVGLKSWIVTAAAAYEVYETDTTRLNILGGGRYLYMDADLDFEIPAISLRERYSDSGSVIDAIIGARGEWRLNEKWYVNYHVDIGTGESDVTWQALAGLNYRFSKVDAAFGYRYLKWEFDDDDTFDELDISGPYAGIRFSF